MRKLLVAVLVTGLFVGALGPAEAGKKRKKTTREETDTYMLPAIGSADVTGVCGVECARFMPSATERYMTIKVEDASGSAPAITVGQETSSGDTGVERIAEVCGESNAPIPITPGVEVVVWVWAAPSATYACDGTGTTGTVTAVFSNLP